MFNDLEVERAVLSGMLQDNSLSVNLKEDHFYDYKNRKIWKVIEELIDSGSAADALTVSNKLKGDVPIDHIMTLDLPTAGNIGFYIDRLLELYRKRKLWAVKNEILDHQDEDSFALRARIEAHFEDFLGTSDNVKAVKNVLKTTIEEIEERYNSHGALTGVPSKIPFFDECTNGLQSGELIIIAARASIGKTAFALTLLKNIAVLGDIPAGFFSCEMSEKQIMMRLFSSIGGVQLRQVKTGMLSDVDFAGIHQAAEYLYECNLFIDDTPNAELKYIEYQSRYMKRQGVKIIIVDYLTLIRHGDKKMPRYERVGEISKRLKQLARELDIPIVALSQVGRSAEGQMPTLADLRQSGEIEEDADIVMFLHRDREESNTVVNIAKNRNGETGTFEMMFHKDYVRFGEIGTTQEGACW